VTKLTASYITFCKKNVGKKLQQKSLQSKTLSLVLLNKQEDKLGQE